MNLWIDLVFLPYCTIKYPSCNGLLDISDRWGGIYVSSKMSDLIRSLATTDDPLIFSGVWGFQGLLSFFIYKDVESTLTIGFMPVLKVAYTNVGKTPPDGVSKINQVSELPALIKKINSAAVSN